MMAPDAISDNTKFIVVTGGVCSSLGKGVATSSIGAVLRAYGFHTTAVKIDPYINEDAGLMSPFEHGEVYVLDDGGEVDLDLGNYERAMNLTLSRSSNITTGKVYRKLLTREREGGYLGKTVQIVPHFTGEVMQQLQSQMTVCTDGTGKAPQICLVEVGGTVGDIESMPFIESLRLMRHSLPNVSDMCVIHLSYVPNMSGQKTKPTQHSVHALQSMGLQPDIIACRCEEPIETSTREKISQLCNVHFSRVLSLHTVANLYKVPVMLNEQRIVEKLMDILKIQPPIIGQGDYIEKPLPEWEAMSEIMENPTKTLRIAFVGKYLGMGGGGSDTYFSAVKALEHAGLSSGYRLDLIWIDAEKLEDSTFRDGLTTELQKCDGIFIPGGFGIRGIEGLVHTAYIARISRIPFFGVCLGMQVALVEIARNVLGIPNANSEEFATVDSPIILKWMPEIDKKTMGANMRLGSRKVSLEKDSVISMCYEQAEQVYERHRHRYEFNTDFKAQFEDAGITFSGWDENKERAEAIEVHTHPFFLAVQYHPEFKSRPFAPSPPFHAFIQAAGSQKYTLSEFLLEYTPPALARHYIEPPTL
ncbi:cytidine triphosphate synthase CTP synthase [Perkinsela sp. CCAP 1560/4]|nr:cytidine triphosphate synthase CTP synthase [Perkinsela sp. CCAP 1560/4]|eukprot:KNH07011.1 cytidine triphosphate synthase CTP synthase [Perkinsela sp. CCAP 1560/4]